MKPTHKHINFYIVIEESNAEIKGLIKEVKDTNASMTMEPADTKNPQGICKELMEFYRNLPNTNAKEGNIFKLVKVNIQTDGNNALRLFIDYEEVSARKYEPEAWDNVINLLNNYLFQKVLTLNFSMNGTPKFELINSFKGKTLK